MLPNFLVIGAMKSGTDSLYRYLRAHPQVFMPDTKEPHYFIEELNWSRGRDWYESLFDAAVGAAAVGEASTTYSKYPTHQGVPERIAAVLPDVRLIYLVRHPIDRIRSQYLHEVLVRAERDPIERALLHQPRYLDYSRYFLQISQYLEFFPPEQLLVITSESLRHSRRDTLRRVFSFLEIDPSWDGEALLREYHHSAEKRVARPLVSRLQRWGAYRAISTLIPTVVKDWSRPLMTRGIDPGEAFISDALTHDLEMTLRDDIVSLREFLGPQFDAWGILETTDRKASS